MPTVVDAEQPGDERGALLAYLEAQRGALRRAVHGLSEEQARSAPSASALSLAGLLKHVAATEAQWLGQMRGTVLEAGPEDYQDYEQGFTPEGDETVPVLIERYEEVGRATEAAVREVESLERTFVVPPAPWHPGGDYSWRWALLHLIEETARHAGHADVIRESVDGKGAFDLVFATGAMPEPDWSAFRQD